MTNNEPKLPNNANAISARAKPKPNATFDLVCVIASLTVSSFAVSTPSVVSEMHSIDIQRVGESVLRKAFPGEL